MILIDTPEERKFEIIATTSEDFIVSITGCGETIGTGMFLTKEQAKELSDYIFAALKLYNERDKRVSETKV